MQEAWKKQVFEAGSWKKWFAIKLVRFAANWVTHTAASMGGVDGGWEDCLTVTQ